MVWGLFSLAVALHWRHNDYDGVSNHRPHGCLLNRLLGRRLKKTSRLRVTGLCAGNSPRPVNSPHKGPVNRKMLFDDVIMACKECPKNFTIIAQRQYWNRRYGIVHFDFDELSFWYFSLYQQCARTTLSWWTYHMHSMKLNQITLVHWHCVLCLYFVLRYDVVCCGGLVSVNLTFVHQVFFNGTAANTSFALLCASELCRHALHQSP